MNSRIRTPLTVLAVAAPLAFPALAHGANAGITSLDPTQPGTPQAVAQALMADPGQLAGASLPEYPYGSRDEEVANPSTLGVGDSAPGLAGFPTSGGSYAILTSGTVADIAALPPSPEEHTFSEYRDQVSSRERGEAEEYTDLRVTVNVPAGANCLAVDYRFFSEEFPTFVGSPFNDAFLAERGGSTWSVGGQGELTRPNDVASSQAGEPISVNGVGPTAMYPSEVGNTYFNAATGLVTTKTPVEPGVQSIDFSILDAGDAQLDSAAFVDNLRFVSEAASTCKPPNDVTAPGVQPLPVGQSPAGRPAPAATTTPKITVGSSVRFGATGTTATLTVNVPGPGQLSASSSATAGAASAASVSKKKRKRGKAKASLLKPTRVVVTKAGAAKLPVKLSATGVKALAKKGKLTVPVTVAYTPAGGGKPTKAVKKITFKRAKKAGRKKR